MDRQESSIIALHIDSMARWLKKGGETPALMEV